MLAKPVCKLTTSFSDVHCLTSSAGDGIDDTGRSTGMASFGVYNSVRAVDVGGPIGKCACSASGSHQPRERSLFECYATKSPFYNASIITCTSTSTGT